MTNVRATRLVYGLATFVPGVYRCFSMSRLPVEETAIDGYSKWLHHLAAVVEGGFGAPPQVVAEIGPGPGFSAGLAALVAGAKTYYALDVVEHADRSILLPVFDEICRLFKSKTALRNWHGIMPARPFPSSVLPDERLSELLAPARLAALRGELETLKPGGPLQMMIPWHSQSLIKKGSVDLVFSTAALEHVDDLETAYRAMNDWLRSGGGVSHVIDYGCHGACNEWNGHWACSNIAWRILKGNRPYFINRQPHSIHLGLLKKNGFVVLSDNRISTPSRFLKKDISPKIRGLYTDQDMTTNLSFLLARKV